MPVSKRPRVVIVGAGFGGLWAARTFAKADVEVLLLDRNNYHTFLALLYQVAAAELYAEDIVYPVRSILWDKRNVTFIMANVQRVDLARQLVATDDSVIHYDYLILATGSTTNYYGTPGAQEYSFPLKVVEHGVALRNHIICCFERASHEEDERKLERLLTFTIVGGGATGVEYAGALSELIQGSLINDYPNIDFNKVRVIVLEKADQLLMGMMPERAREYAADRLRWMGVEVRFGARVDRVFPEAIHLADGEVIPTETVVWTAGVKGDPLAKVIGLPVSRDGRATVLPTLQAPEHPNVYVVGDLAYVDHDGKPLPFVAQVAIQTGKKAAGNIIRQIEGEEPEPFSYWDRGTMVTIGRNAAAVHTRGRQFVGLLAWLLWAGLHIFYLIGFRNRIAVMINWAWDYLLFQRPVRFVFPADYSLLRKAARCAYGADGESEEDKAKRHAG